MDYLAIESSFERQVKKAVLERGAEMVTELIAIGVNNGIAKAFGGGR